MRLQEGQEIIPFNVKALLFYTQILKCEWWVFVVPYSTKRKEEDYHPQR